MQSHKAIANVGLKEHLNETKGLHNNQGYDAFVERVRLNEPLAIIARAFNVSRMTIWKWKRILEQEKD